MPNSYTERENISLIIILSNVYHVRNLNIVVSFPSMLLDVCCIEYYSKTIKFPEDDKKQFNLVIKLALWKILWWMENIVM